MDRFDTDIDTEAWDKWECILRFKLPPLTPIHDTGSIDNLIDDIYRAFNKACKAMMKTVGVALGFNSRWWNNECKAAAQAMRGGFWTDEEQQAANLHLKKVVKVAKREWANEYITMANIWEVVAWRHGRRSSHIPALRGRDRNLVHGHEEMATLLSERFFTEEGNPIPLHFLDDPPPKTRAYSRTSGRRNYSICSGPCQRNWHQVPRGLGGGY
jgi:hypothetical protein